MITGYFLYVIIDYATHIKLFQHGGFYYWHLLIYYFYQFSKHAEILMPIVLLISTLKVILTANIQRELLVLMSAGISLKKIGRPFLLFGICTTFLCYLNFEYLQPIVYLKLSAFEQSYLHKTSHTQNSLIHPLTLEDQSLLVYHMYDPIHNELKELFWKKNEKEIYKIQCLQLTPIPPKGLHVDYLAYDDTLSLKLIDRYEEIDFATMTLPSNLSPILRPLKWHSISSLAHLFPKEKGSKLNDKQAAAATHFFYKLFMPLVAIIIVFASLSLCTRFTRNFSSFLIYLFFLCGYITFFTLLNASVILGENQIVHPLVAICLPVGALLLVFGYKYAKL
jgi:lipopolysaccharide export system permease protein